MYSAVQNVAMPISLLLYILTLISLFGYCAFGCVYGKWRIEKMPLFAVSLLITLLYILAFCRCLRIGSYILFGAGFILLGLALIQSSRTGRMAKLFTPGSCFFLLASLLVWFYYHPVVYSTWDEFSHWGFAVKEMLRFHSLIPPDSVLPYKDYPPGPSLFHYYFSLFVGQYEGVVVVAHNLFITAAVTVVLTNVSWRAYNRIIALLSSTIIVILLLTFSLRMIFVDTLIGVVFGMALISYLSDENTSPWQRIVPVIPTLFVLPLLKQPGFLFAIIVAVIILVDQLALIYRQAASADPMRAVRFCCLAVLLLVPFVSFGSWGSHVRTYQYATTTPCSVTFTRLIHSFNPQTATNRDRSVISQFYCVQGNRSLDHQCYSRLLTVENLLILVAILLIVTSLLAPSPQRRRTVVLVHLFFLLGFMVYEFGLLCLYLYGLTLPEAIILASFDRYTGIYFFAYLHVSLFLFIQQIKLPAPRRWPAYAMTALLVSFFWGFPEIPGKFGGSVTSGFPMHEISRERRNAIRSLVDRVHTITGMQSKIYVVWQNSNGLEYQVTRYELAPCLTNNWFIGTSESSYKLDCINKTHDVNVWAIPPKEWAKYLINMKYDYVLVCRNYPIFWLQYSTLFDQETLKVSHTLFRIQKTMTGSVRLIGVL